MATGISVGETTAVYLGDLLDAGDGATVTLVAGETRLVAHRAVLAARSPVLEGMFRHDSEITIPDVEGPVLRQLLSYCYTLRTPQLPSMAPQLLAAAERYGLSRLKARCEQQLATQLAVENAAATAVLAVRHRCPSLRQAAATYIKAHTRQVMATQGWADVMCNQPQYFIEVNRLISETPTKPSAPATGRGRPTSGTRPSSDHSRDLAAAAPPGAPRRHLPDCNEDLRRVFDPYAGSRLLQAVEEGTVEDVRALLAAGEDVETRTSFWETALHWAARRGREDVARCLLEAGAEVDARSAFQYTPLKCAAEGGHAAVVRLLVASFADPNTRDMWGKTPLHYAAEAGHAQAVAALLEAEADRGVKDEELKTPLDLAKQKNHREVVEMLT